MTVFQLILLFLAASVFAVVIFRMLDLPPMLGYLSVGAVIAPYAHQWIPSHSALEALAEFGIVFLMFSVGLEFSLSELRRMWRWVFFLGGGQVLLTVLVATGIVHIFNGSWQHGVLIGAVLAMSSTAIGGKLLAERGEMDSEHGRAMIGIFLLQDLITVPLLIVLPLLGDMPHDLTWRVGEAFLKIALMFILIFWLGKPMIQWWFRVVADRNSHELFMLNLFLITLGFAYITSIAGLSMALGALMAGMLISGTEFHFQVSKDIQPYEDVLLGLFFITIGMRLDPLLVAEYFGAVLLVLAAMLIFKFIIIFVLCYCFDMETAPALKTSLGVCGAGEFGFVLLSVCQGQLPVDMEQPILAAMVLSMFIQPFLILYSDKIVMRFSKSEWLQQSAQITQLAVRTLSVKKHVILCGYGETGQRIGKILAAQNIKFIAIDPNAKTIRQARAEGEPVEFGDATRFELLLAAGLKRAAAVIVTFTANQNTFRILQHARMARPDMPVIVRAQKESAAEALLAAGADEVIQDAFEAAMMLGSYALICCGTPIQQAFGVTRQMRGERFSLFRGIFQNIPAESLDTTMDDVLIHSVRIPANSEAIGKTLAEFGLVEPFVVVVMIRRQHEKIQNPSNDTCLEPDDLLVLVGRNDHVTAAETRLKSH